MLTENLKIRLLWLAEGLLLVGAFLMAAHLSSGDEWEPLALVGLLLVLSLVAEQFDFTIRGQHLSASFIALMLTMALLGPAPAVAFGLAAMILNSSVRRLSAPLWLNNLATYAVFPLVGGLLVRAVIGDVHAPANHQADSERRPSRWSCSASTWSRWRSTSCWSRSTSRSPKGARFSGRCATGSCRCCPGTSPLGTFAAVLAIAYTNLGLSLLFGSIIVLLAFQYLMRALLRSEDRADQLEARSIHLASLQLGVLSTLVETLALRDKHDRSTRRGGCAATRAHWPRRSAAARPTRT